MQEITIDAKNIEKSYWGDVWRFRELFVYFAWRDILVRYKQTVVGVAWALFRPLLTMLIMTFVFGRIAQLPSGGAPYPIFVFSAQLPWLFFATAFSASSNSLVAASSMLTKVYFPRLIVPTSAVITTFADFCISLVILAGMMAYYGYTPSLSILALPIFILITFLLSLGAGLWISVLMVRYRDFKIIVPFIVQLGFYMSPVGYSITSVPEQFQTFYALNPMVGIIEGFRWAILGGDFELPTQALYVSLAAAVIILYSGVLYFRKMEKTFADYI